MAATDTSSNAEILQAQSMIIIHPGSKYLRIGRASDINPHTVLHAIAKPKKNSSSPVHLDEFLVKEAKLDKETSHKVEESLLQTGQLLQSCLKSDGARRVRTELKLVATLNRQCQPIQGPTSNLQWVEASGSAKYIIGDQVMYCHPRGAFSIHFPMHRGDLNLHNDIGGSLSSVMHDLEVIWGYCIENLLQIPLATLQNYKAVLVIPDIYQIKHIKELMTLLLCKLKFGGCFLIQDHVAATFGAGLGYACVVDIGDQKTSISCVEDALSHKSTRLRLDYGGSDITQVFFWLMQKCGFPYKACNPLHPLDAALLTRLKENNCHLNLDLAGVRETNFAVERPGQHIQRYTFKIGDERLIAPLSLFSPDMFLITGSNKKVHSYPRYTGDAEDPHDATYLRETSRKYNRGDADAGAGDGDADDELAEEGGNAKEEGKDDNMEFQPDVLLGLDQAILQSIERCPEDLKRKMYSCILLVGGGVKFEGIERWLQNRFHMQVPYIHRSEQMEIVVRPKDMDPSMVTWKGAAVMSCLEAAQELWIKPEEWAKQGMRLLRERAPFIV